LPVEGSAAGVSASRKKGPEVFLHDPASAMPHNLDDPFYDAKVQEKVGKIVAGRQ
jgi:hypothetical protein